MWIVEMCIFCVKRIIICCGFDHHSQILFKHIIFAKPIVGTLSTQTQFPD